MNHFKLVPSLGGLILGIAGFLTLFWGVFTVYKAYETASWPHTTGIIQESRVEYTPSSHGGSFSPGITYRYTVNGRSYVSHKIDPSMFWSRKSSCQLVADYPAGSQQPVYFSPTNSEDSILSVGLHARSFQSLVLALLLISVAALFSTVAYLAPTYAKKQPDGSYFFDMNSPVTKPSMVGLLIIIGLFVLLFNLV